MFRRRKKEIPSLFNHSNFQGRIDIERGSSIDHQLSMIGISKEDLRILRLLQPYVKENITEVIDQFYSNLEHEPALIQIINSNSSIERLKRTLRRHVLEMFTGEIDETYIKKRHRIAYVHVQIGLGSKWYLAAFQDILSSFIELIDREVGRRDEAFQAIQAVTKIINLEEQLVLEMYEEEVEVAKQAEQSVRKNVRKDIMATSETLASICQETNAAVEDLIAQSDEMASVATKSSELSDSARTKATSGKEEMYNLALNMERIVHSIQEMRTDAEQLNSIMKEMQNIIKIVSGIAEETNLLSLNASIEAARAGEAGRGFAIVAEEVRKLSDQTKTSVVNVASLINNTNEQVNQLTATLERIGEDVTTGNQSSKVTEEHFAEIVETMSDTNQQNYNMAAEINGFVESIRLLGQSFEEVASSADGLNALTNELE